LGLGTIDHEMPFHTIANVFIAESVTVYPTATQSDTLRHDTDDSMSSLVPAIGLETTDQADPFHTIANVTLPESVCE